MKLPCRSQHPNPSPQNRMTGRRGICPEACLGMLWTGDTARWWPSVQVCLQRPFCGQPHGCPILRPPTNRAEVPQGLLNPPGLHSHCRVTLRSAGSWQVQSVQSVPLLFLPIWILQERRKRAGSHPWAGALSPSWWETLEGQPGSADGPGTG